MSSMLDYHTPHLSLQPEGMEKGGGHAHQLESWLEGRCGEAFGPMLQS
jgi:hypothetical protein